MIAENYFAELIVDKQKELGWSNAELARRVGKSPGTVSAWINNDIFPEFSTQQRLARVLEVPLAEIIDRIARSKQARLAEGGADVSQVSVSESRLSELIASFQKLPPAAQEMLLLFIRCLPEALASTTFLVAQPEEVTRTRRHFHQRLNKITSERLQGQGVEQEEPQ